MWELQIRLRQTPRRGRLMKLNPGLLKRCGADNRESLLPPGDPFLVDNPPLFRRLGILYDSHSIFIVTMCRSLSYVLVTLIIMLREPASDSR